MSKKKSPKNNNYRCSFCGKSQDEVKKLIAGPTVFICDECIELCNEIMVEEWAQAKSEDVQHLLKPKDNLQSPRKLYYRAKPLQAHTFSRRSQPFQADRS